jgi:hypothetical protein
LVNLVTLCVIAPTMARSWEISDVGYRNGWGLVDLAVERCHELELVRVLYLYNRRCLSETTLLAFKQSNLKGRGGREIEESCDCETGSLSSALHCQHSAARVRSSGALASRSWWSEEQEGHAGGVSSKSRGCPINA